MIAGTLSTRRRLLAVLAGGFCGALSRYGLSLLIQGWLGKGWPFDMLIINLTGALALAFVTVLADATFLVGPTRRLFINVGFLGAYTTFSSLALGDVQLFAKGSWPSALLYLVLSLGGGLLAVLLGDWLAQRFLRLVRRSTVVHTHASSASSASPKHVDIEDDLLLPDRVSSSSDMTPMTEQ